MINLSAEVLSALEKIAEAEDDFIELLKGISGAANSRVRVAPGTILPIHAVFLLHLAAHLVDAQIRIEQLEGQMAILNTGKEDM